MPASLRLWFPTLQTPGGAQSPHGPLKRSMISYGTGSIAKDIMFVIEYSIAYRIILNRICYYKPVPNTNTTLCNTLFDQNPVHTNVLFESNIFDLKLHVFVCMSASLRLWFPTWQTARG